MSETTAPRWPPLLALPAIAVIQVVGTFGASQDNTVARPIDALSIALLLAGPVILVAAGRRPLLAVALVLAVTFVYLARGYPNGPVVISPVEPGDRTTIQLPQPVEVTIVGIATFGDADGFGAVTFTGFTLDAAERYLGAGTGAGTGVITSVLVAGDAGTDSEELAARVDARCCRPGPRRSAGRR